MRQDLSHVLEKCLRLMRAGASIEECLERFPEHADDLRSKLALASQLTQAEPASPPAEAIQRGKNRLTAALAAWRDPRTVKLVGISFGSPMPLLRRLSPAYQVAAVLGAVVLMASAVMGASAAGGPGSFFPFGSSSSSEVPVPVNHDVGDDADEDDDNADGDGTVTPTPTPDDDDADEDSDDGEADDTDEADEEIEAADDDDADDADGTVTPTPTPGT